MATADFDKLNEAARRRPPRMAIVLGSGLGRIAERVAPVAACGFADVPGLAATNIPGHAGQVLLGDWSGLPVLVFAGRLHFYEGHPWERVLLPIRLVAGLGVKRLLLTNAAGGIRDDLTPGTLMVVRAHLDWTRRRPLPEHPAVSEGYSKEIAECLHSAARLLHMPLAEGTYAAVLGPNYETPAEIRALRALGADAVGMSVVREVESAVAAGVECAAANCITNRAAGLSPTPLSHEEVLQNSRRQAARLGDLLERFLAMEAGRWQAIS